MKSLNISEIFYSLQGETSFAGLPCIFIRLAECNLRCSYCDTKFAYETNYTSTIEEIILKIQEFLPVKLVMITGGEPLLQENAYNLLDLLLENNYKILLETNGSILLDRVPAKVIKIVDFKTPSSQMSERMNWENINHILSEDEIKFVIKDKDDFRWSLEKIRKFNLENRNILFSPVHDKLEAKELAQWILNSKKNFKLQIQLQKYLWGNKRGV